MRVLFFGNKSRGIACLDAVRAAGHEVVAAVAHAGDARPFTSGSFAAYADSLGLGVHQPADPDDVGFLETVRALAPDILVMAGYGPILREPLLTIAPRGCLNLHGGKLPERRGSSPMNWALIDGEPTVTLSVIRADRGVDTGDVLVERTFPIGPDDTIAQVQAIADETFPLMLVEALGGLASGILIPRPQANERAAYYPLRFPDDGFILWDMLDAVAIHNHIRALTTPFPGAFSYWRGRKVMLLASAIPKNDYRGVPGRIYIKNENGLLVSARDRCLWITKATFENDGDDAIPVIPRYERLTTMREAVQAWAATPPGAHPLAGFDPRS